jgi:hypothetical protein
MLKTFGCDEDTVEERRQINQLLRKLDARISIDAKQQLIGLSVGEGDIAWQHLSPRARLAALKEGIVNPYKASDYDWGYDVQSYENLFPDDNLYNGILGVQEIDDWSLYEDWVSRNSDKLGTFSYSPHPSEVGHNDDADPDEWNRYMYQQWLEIKKAKQE